MKKISFALFFCLCALAGFAQNSKPLDLKEIVSGEFIPQNISGVIPIPGDGEHYSQMNADKTQIIKYSFKTGKPVEVLFDAATARECPFKKFDSYSFAPDMILKAFKYFVSLRNYFLLIARSIATAIATVAPTIGLLPIPRKPIIST